MRAITMFKLFHTTVFVSAIVMLSVGFIYLPSEKNQLKSNNKSKNYFKDAARLKDLGLLVNTSGCKIPNFDVFDDEIIPFIHPAKLVEDCLGGYFNWSYVEGQNLILNTAQIEKDGYQFENLKCCYKKLSRDSSPEKITSGDADNFVSYSPCTKITTISTKIDHSLLMVECSSWDSILELIPYRGYHAVAFPNKNDSRSDIIQRKVDYWNKDDKKKKTPPSILVIGIDSTSRLNFRRNMFKTRAVLESLGAVEMFGYGKVGENTFPNFLPLFTGYSEEDIYDICHNATDYFDNCPFLWEQFDEGNYLTAQTEDGPEFTAFNYKKSGFKNQPTDFYPRLAFIAAHDYGLAYLPVHYLRSDHEDCIGPYTNDEFISNYLESTMNFAMDKNTPIFTFSWSTTLPHDDLNMIQTADESYANMISRLKSNNAFENTILIFMGDHGYRFGPVRGTLVGYYEDRLPNMWITLPERVKKDHPEWVRNLQINQFRLATPYTMYWTFQSILKAYSNNYKPPSTSYNAKTGKLIERKFKTSYFDDEISEGNNCETAGIPSVYCPCYPLEYVDLDDTILKIAVDKSIEKINNDLINREMCEPFSIGTITAAARMPKPELKLIRYISTFSTIPGGFLFETEIDYSPTNSTFSTRVSVQRADRIDKTKLQCVNNDAKLELYCYCKQELNN